MANQKFNYSNNDVEQASHNNQRMVAGTNIDTTEGGLNEKETHFVTAIIGATVTLKDKGGNTVLVTGTNGAVFFNPIRLDGGFKATSSASSTIVFFTLVHP